MRIKRVLLCVLACVLLCLPLLTTACDSNGSDDDTPELSVLPPPEPDGGMFGVDVNINMSTIDDYLNRPDVSYFDMRMFYDPADFEAIGGVSKLTRTLPGYRIVPFPFLASVGPLPVDGAYDGDSLFYVEWGENREILVIRANYAESEIIFNQIFPKDRTIFLMCGGAGYTSLMRALLFHFGYDESKIYHTGGNWHYEGNMGLDLTISASDSNIATWRADYAFIDFDHLTRIG